MRRELYIKSDVGLLVEVQAICTDMQEANDFLVTHPGMGVLAEEKPFIFIAKVEDGGYRGGD